MTVEPAQTDEHVQSERAKQILLRQHRDIVRLQAENKRLRELAPRPADEPPLSLVVAIWAVLGAGWPFAIALYLSVWGVDLGAIGLLFATIAYIFSLAVLLC